MSEQLSEFYLQYKRINQYNIIFTISGSTKESAGSGADILMTDKASYGRFNLSNLITKLSTKFY